MHPACHACLAGPLIPSSTLAPQEEHDLALAAHHGNDDARNQLICAHLKLVVSIARRFLGRGLSLDDLVGEGSLGLVRAAQHFNPGLGTRFSTYAAFWIKDALHRALNASVATIRLPAHTIRLLSAWREMERCLTERYGRVPTTDQVAHSLGLTQANQVIVEQAIRSRRFYSPVYGESDGLMENLVDARSATEPSPDGDEERAVLRRRLSHLTPRERTVVELRYGLDGLPPRTYREIGDRIGMSRKSTHCIELRALAKLAAANGPGNNRSSRREIRTSQP